MNDPSSNISLNDFDFKLDFSNPVVFQTCRLSTSLCQSQQARARLKWIYMKSGLWYFLILRKAREKRRLYMYWKCAARQRSISDVFIEPLYVLANDHVRIHV